MMKKTEWIIKILLFAATIVLADGERKEKLQVSQFKDSNQHDNVAGYIEGKQFKCVKLIPAANFKFKELRDKKGQASGEGLYVNATPARQAEVIQDTAVSIELCRRIVEGTPNNFELGGGGRLEPLQIADGKGKGGSEPEEFYWAVQAHTINFQISSLSYAGEKDKYIIIQRDDGSGPYNPPHWFDKDLDQEPESVGPIAFTRNTKGKISAKIQIINPVIMTLPKLVQVKATGPDGLTVGPVDVKVDNGAITLKNQSFNQKFVDTIKCYEKFKLVWEVKYGDNPWQHSGETETPVCIMWADCKASTNKRLWTVVHVSTKAADGVGGKTGTQADEKVLAKIWAKFKSRKIHRVSDGKLMSYYGFLDKNDNGKYDPGVDEDKNTPDKCGEYIIVNNKKNRIGYVNVEKLLSKLNGQCGAWVDFMQSMLLSHGIKDVNKKKVVVFDILPGTKYHSMAIKNWKVGGNFKAGIIKYMQLGITGDEVIGDVEIGQWMDAKGITGQGNSPNPPSNFRRHVALKIADNIYDPSYGICEKDEKAYKALLLEGYIKAVRPGVFYMYSINGK